MPKRPRSCRVIYLIVMAIVFLCFGVVPVIGSGEVDAPKHIKNFAKATGRTVVKKSPAINGGDIMSGDYVTVIVKNENCYQDVEDVVREDSIPVPPAIESVSMQSLEADLRLAEGDKEKISRRIFYFADGRTSSIRDLAGAMTSMTDYCREQIDINRHDTPVLVLETVAVRIVTRNIEITRSKADAALTKGDLAVLIGAVAASLDGAGTVGLLEASSDDTSVSVADSGDGIDSGDTVSVDEEAFSGGPSNGVVVSGALNSGRFVLSRHDGELSTITAEGRSAVELLERYGSGPVVATD